MSENTSQPKNEEIELGQLFKLIGKGFQKIGDLIKSIFNFILQMILIVVIFIRQNIIKIAIVGILGVLLGWIIDNAKEPEFEASMVVKPNYQSGRQLYKNIAFYDELITQEKFSLLSETFGISLVEAQTLVSFEIEPVVDENYMLSTYDEFLSSIDSTVALNFEYESYTSNFKNFSYSEHEITVTSTISEIFPELEVFIVSGIKSNPFFQQLEESEKLILKRNEKFLQASLLEVDTLRKVYTEVLIKESEKQTPQGTNINMAGGNESTREMDLFVEENRINTNIDILNRAEVRNIEILNVVSSFQTIGFRKNDVIEKWTFRLPIILITLLIVGLLIMKLEVVLVNQNK